LNIIPELLGDIIFTARRFGEIRKFAYPRRRVYDYRISQSDSDTVLSSTSTNFWITKYQCFEYYTGMPSAQDDESEDD